MSTMECAVPLGCNNKAPQWSPSWCQTAAGDHIGLTSELWLSVHFSGHTMAAFPVKCIEEPAFGSPPTPPHPAPYKLNP